MGRLSERHEEGVNIGSNLLPIKVEGWHVDRRLGILITVGGYRVDRETKSKLRRGMERGRQIFISY